MFRKAGFGMIILTVAIFLTGCSGSAPAEKTVQAQNPQGLAEAKAVLDRYAKGAPMTSEVANFPTLIAEVKKEDPAKGDILEKGLADLQKAHKSELPAKAKALLSKL